MKAIDSCREEGDGKEVKRIRDELNVLKGRFTAVLFG